MIPDRVPL